MYAALLSGDAPEIGVEELRSLGFKVYRVHGRIAVFEDGNLQDFQKVAFAHLAIELFSFRKPYKIIIKKIKPCPDFKRETAIDGLALVLGKPISMLGTKIYSITHAGLTFVGREVARTIKDWNRKERNPANYAKPHPASLPPKLARAMLNIAKGNKILDPFCGAGVLLVEGSFLGKEMHGMDISEEMLFRARKNLEAFGFEPRLKLGDARRLSSYFEHGSFDAIVTEPPFGRAAKVYAKSLEELLRKSFAEMLKVVKKGGRIVLSHELDLEEVLGVKPVFKGVYGKGQVRRIVHVF